MARAAQIAGVIIGAALMLMATGAGAQRGWYALPIAPVSKITNYGAEALGLAIDVVAEAASPGRRGARSMASPLGKYSRNGALSLATPNIQNTCMGASV